MLFNLYMSKLPLPAKDINITSYTDDVTLTTSQPQVEQLRDMIILYLNNLHAWLESRKLKLSAKNSSATVFTTWNKEAKFDPNLGFHNQQYKLVTPANATNVPFTMLFVNYWLCKNARH